MKKIIEKSNTAFLLVLMMVYLFYTKASVSGGMNELVFYITVVGLVFLLVMNLDFVIRSGNGNNS